MLNKEFKIGGLLGFAALIYWIIASSSYLYSMGIYKIVIYIIDFLFISFWIYLNYSSFSSVEDKRKPLSLKVIQVYTIPIIIATLGVIGINFKIDILSMIYTIYFLPFINITAIYANKIIYINNYLIAPFFVMIPTTLLALIYYKTKNHNKKYR